MESYTKSHLLLQLLAIKTYCKRFFSASSMPNFLLLISSSTIHLLFRNETPTTNFKQQPARLPAREEKEKEIENSIMFLR
jgi:hypothetical protein